MAGKGQFRQVTTAGRGLDPESHPGLTGRPSSSYNPESQLTYWGVDTCRIDDGVAVAADASDQEVFVWSEKEFLSLAKTLANFSGNINDAITVLSQIQEFGLKNAFSTNRWYVKTIKGKKYVILKGYPGLRRTLNLTKYAPKDPRIVNLAIGTRGLARSVTRSGVISVVFVGAFDVVEYVIRDEKGGILSDLAVSVSSDVTKTAIAASAGAIATAITAVVASGGLALPIVAGVAISIYVSSQLDDYDEKHQITKNLREWVIVEIEEPADKWWDFLNRPEGIYWLMRQMSR